MRVSAWSCILGLALLGFTGCRGKAARYERQGQAQPRSSVTREVPTPQKPVIVPANTFVGKVARVNPIGRFAVITFPIGHLPALEQRLDVYRGGLKVGEVKVTGPQLDDSMVADITIGEVQPGDEARP